MSHLYKKHLQRHHFDWYQDHFKLLICPFEFNLEHGGTTGSWTLSLSQCFTRIWRNLRPLRPEKRRPPPYPPVFYSDLSFRDTQRAEFNSLSEFISKHTGNPAELLRHPGIVVCRDWVFKTPRLGWTPSLSNFKPPRGSKFLRHQKGVWVLETPWGQTLSASLSFQNIQGI